MAELKKKLSKTDLKEKKQLKILKKLEDKKTRRRKGQSNPNLNIFKEGCKYSFTAFLIFGKDIIIL